MHTTHSYLGDRQSEVLFVLLLWSPLASSYCHDIMYGTECETYNVIMNAVNSITCQYFGIMQFMNENLLTFKNGKCLDRLKAIIQLNVQQC